MLHTLHRSPWLTDFPALLRLLSEGDELLLLQDGVIAAVGGNCHLESLLNAPIKVYALNEDLIARGLIGQISNSVIRIDYTDFVRLTVKHTSQLAW
ncbi:sulfurtransferase complex subunit TusB [Escherichia coli]|nr:sulfurtransferase complex subunit TusB [Escherichia coli]EGI6809124.1 sulfurtransferase complex subunit TusB [Escherichia coli]EHD2968291.1 sulfurtransferase complex subunit TusB [Escherichia coli]EHE9876512.1 sulfurtransferase complex subunit TusB [Escherichia coli]EII9938421.1 sulfurtransferase complex subunit TusB [Escherichia coli]